MCLVLLSQLLLLPQVNIPQAPAQPSAIMNPYVDLNSQLESKKQQEKRLKSRGTLLGAWLAGPRPPPKPANMWLWAVRLIVDPPSCWDEPANGRYFDPLAYKIHGRL